MQSQECIQRIFDYHGCSCSICFTLSTPPDMQMCVQNLRLKFSCIEVRTDELLFLMFSCIANRIKDLCPIFSRIKVRTEDLSLIPPLFVPCLRTLTSSSAMNSPRLLAFMRWSSPASLEKQIFANLCRGWPRKLLTITAWALRPRCVCQSTRINYCSDFFG